MKLLKRIPDSTAAGVCAILQPFISDISPDLLRAALRGHQPDSGGTAGPIRWISIAEFARRCGASRCSVWRWIKEKRLQKPRYFGERSPRLPESALMALCSEEGAK